MNSKCNSGHVRIVEGIGLLIPNCDVSLIFITRSEKPNPKSEVRTPNLPGLRIAESLAGVSSNADLGA